MENQMDTPSTPAGPQVEDPTPTEPQLEEPEQKLADDVTRGVLRVAVLRLRRLPYTLHKGDPVVRRADVFSVLDRMPEHIGRQIAEVAVAARVGGGGSS